MSHKNSFPHFNPNRYDLKVKIASVRTSAHSKHNINYHLVWIPKYRKLVLKGRVGEILREIIEGNCKDMHLELLALEVMPDHIHCFVGALPTHTPYKIVKQIKGNTSIQLRRVFPDLKYLGYKKHYKRFPSLWARGYYCGSAGHVSQDSVKRYILEQEGKDVFDYNIYGCPSGMDIRIGNFTQSKIGDYSG